MSFVDHEARNLQLFDDSQELFGRESFGRDIQQPQTARACRIQGIAPRVGREQGVQGG